MFPLRQTLIILAFWIGSHCHADIIRVGPDQAITRISEAARIARDGDTVLVTAGLYRGDVAVWRQRALTIRSVGGRAVLRADGRHAEGKAIWVIRNGRFNIQGFELVGARVPDGNGAGIRFERGELTVADCLFRDNQMGLLTGNDRSAVLRIQDSWFADAPRQEGSLPHLLYVGRIKRFEATGSRFENGYRGHLVKSRAQSTVLRYNRIGAGPTGAPSYEVDLSNGGDAVLVGNLIVQSPRSGNRTLVAYGAEGTAWPSNQLVMVHNTLVTLGEVPGTFVRLWPEKQSARYPVRVETRNNLLIGPGDRLDTLPGHHEGNAASPRLRPPPATRADLRNIAARLAERIDLVPPTDMRSDLVPSDEPGEAVGRDPIEHRGSWLPGAFQNPTK